MDHKRGGSKRRGRDFGSDRSGGGGGFRSNSGPNRFGSGPKETHKAICAECGKECDVPFKPTKGKPVYCRDCFAKRKPKRFEPRGRY